ncbi:TBRG1 regulator, partial [Polypterus senegalus]
MEAGDEIQESPMIHGKEPERPRSERNGTDDERQQALRGFTAQPFISATSQNQFASQGSGGPSPSFSASSNLSESRVKAKKVLRKSQNEKYRLKYLRLQKAARAMIFENAALCDEIAHLEEKFIQAKEERRFLLKTLLQYQSLTEGDIHMAPSTSSHPQASFSSSGIGGLSVGTTPVLGQGISGGEDSISKKCKKDRKDRGKENGREDVLKRVSKKKKTAECGSRRLVQPIPLDSSGRPVFPIVLGGLTVYSLGEIITDRPNFHDESAIYPVGFCSTRMFASMKNPDQQCLYTCQIKDGGDGPQFEIVPEDDPQNAIVGSSALACHTNLLKAIGAIRQVVDKHYVVIRLSLPSLISDCLDSPFNHQPPPHISAAPNPKGPEYAHTEVTLQNIQLSFGER